MDRQEKHRANRHRALGLAALMGGVLAALGGCQDSNSGGTSVPGAPLAIAGTHLDSNGASFSITQTTWTDPTGAYHIAAFSNSGAFVIAQNDSINLLNPSKWSRFDWTVYQGDLYACHTTGTAPTQTDAAAAPAADATTPAANGCGGSPWTHLNGPLDIVYAYMDAYGTSHGIAQTTWTQTYPYNAGTQVDTYAITLYGNLDEFLVAQNGANNAFNQNLWSRFDWAVSRGHLYYCQTAYAAPDQPTAMNTPRSDDTHPATSGCGGAFPWTQLN